MKKKTPKYIIDKIIEMKKEGFKNHVIAKILLVGSGTVKYYLDKHNGITHKEKTKKYHPYAERVYRFRKNAKNQPYTLKDIINKFTETPVCYLTGTTIDIYDRKSYHFDHMIPISRGGDNSIDNIGICHVSANKMKASLTPEEYIQLCEKVVDYQNSKKVKVIKFSE